jgi:hypothetical protein
VQHLLLLHFSMSRSPYSVCGCVAVKTRLLLSIFSEGADALQVVLVLFSVITLIKCK